jgi:hypothetical protein
VNTPTDIPNSARAEEEALARLVKRAEAGDLSVLPQLRAALDGNSALWKSYGDLAAQAEASLVQLAAGKNLLLAESLMRKLAALKEELGGEAPSPLDKLLIERVTATWLQVAFYDAVLTQTTGSSEAR